MSEVTCPKCKCEQPVDEPSGALFDAECCECGFEFVVEVEMEPIYTVTCKEHDWGEWRDTIYEVDRWRVCLTCDAMETRRGSDD